MYVRLFVVVVISMAALCLPVKATIKERSKRNAPSNQGAGCRLRFAYIVSETLIITTIQI